MITVGGAAGAVICLLNINYGRTSFRRWSMNKKVHALSVKRPVAGLSLIMTIRVALPVNRALSAVEGCCAIPVTE